MTWNAVIDGCMDGCIVLVRGVIGMLVVIVLVNALTMHIAGNPRNRLRVALKSISDQVAAPSRALLPKGACTGRWDVAPLLSSVLLLLIGYGFEAFLLAMRAGR